MDMDMERNLTYLRGVYTIHAYGNTVAYDDPNTVAAVLVEMGVEKETIILVIVDAVSRGVCTF